MTQFLADNRRTRSILSYITFSIVSLSNKRREGCKQDAASSVYSGLLLSAISLKLIRGLNV